MVRQLFPIGLVLTVTLLILVVSIQPASPTIGPLSYSLAGSLRAPNRPMDTVGSNFTYQGFLTNATGAVNGTYDFQFSLWDAPSGGNPIGSVQTVPNQPVSNGFFTATPNFGVDAFQGTALWLQIAVRPSTGGNFSLLTPRQLITATPYAISLVPGATIVGTINTPMVTLNNTGSGNGLQSNSANGDGVVGQAGAGHSGVVGHNNGTGPGVQGYSTSGDGVFGQAGAGQNGVYGNNTDGGTGVFGNSGGGNGVYGNSTTGHGVSGTSNGDDGVYGTSTVGSKAGVHGINDISGGYGVWGSSNAGIGVYGTSGSGGTAGYFAGNVNITGNLTKGGGSFKIDDPIDPANKYLYHSFVESPDMKNIYDGVVVLDTQGTAWIDLPAWFQALNRDFRYQLTCIGGYAPVYISQEIQANRFQIAGGHPGLKVSWQVTGIRQDPYANRYRIPVEQDKPAGEQGTYLHPELYDPSGAPQAP